MRHDAHLTALFGVQFAAVDTSVAYAASSVAATLLLEAHERSKSAARAALEAARAATTVQAGWAEVEEGASLLPAFIRQAHCTDLVVLGQEDPDQTVASQFTAALAASVVLGGGRRELVFGGATRVVLRSMTVPVHMSH